MKGWNAKVLLAILLCGMIVACTNGANGEAYFPLPDGAEVSDAFCPAAAMSEGDICYKILLSHKQTIDWFEEVATSEQWHLQWTSDDEPFSAFLTKNNKRLYVIVYRQQEEQFTGVLLKES